MGKRIVIALGGNALGKNLPEQMLAVKETSKAIADLVEAGHTVAVAHGNGPQVGMIQKAMTELTRSNPEKYIPCPLSVCVAMSQGYIGYDLQNARREELLNRNITDIPVATMITQVRVDAEDPAFETPSKLLMLPYVPRNIDVNPHAVKMLIKNPSIISFSFFSKVFNLSI